MNCAGCQWPLSDVDLQRGTCSRCGSAVSPAAVATMDSASGSAADAAKTGTADSRSIAATIESARNQAVTPPPVALGKEPDRYAATRDELDAPALRQRVTAIWSDRVSVEAGARTSLKPRLEALGPQTHLVIRSRFVDPTGTPGEELADYELHGKLGEGGMGLVMSARQASLNRSVAVKFLKPASVDDPVAQEKFLTEAAVTGDLEHPNIVPVYDLGKDQAGALFYSMKHVRGTPWSAVIRQKTLAENLDILMRVADAIAYAHSRGVIHRDLKPENVMLGSFGEVLLMDWGLAVSAEIDPAVSGMAGTPAYMAPEMAVGPIERVGPASDVYLLGAVLYEVVSGLPPHAGKDAMECLYAAARNQIQPTDADGELAAIALKAMATEPEQRYADATALQEAIREHLSHTESLSLSTRAGEDLEEARIKQEYDGFARALFGFQEAHALWDDNAAAREGIVEVSLAYAACALDHGDYDLGASLLRTDEPQHAELLSQIREAQRERDSRQRRLRAAKRISLLLLSLVFAIVTVAFFWIRSEYQRAENARADAESQWHRAETEKDRAEGEKDRAEGEWKRAEVEKDRAEREKDRAEKGWNEAVAAREAERRQKEAAERAQFKERIAQRRQEYEAYVAQIGLAAAKIEENAFDVGRSLLDGCSAPLRHWEWGRLRQLCAQDLRTFDAPWPLEAVALAPGEKLLAAGGWGDKVRVWDIASGAEVHALSTEATRVFALAFSPDGRHLAAGTNAQRKYVTIWDLQTARVVNELKGHTDAVLSVTYSRDGKRLLTTSYDQTARLWDIATGQVDRLLGHEWWVWSAAFSNDERHAVTACQDGSATIWSLETGKDEKLFLGHAGPVYTAAFSPGGQWVATAGYDKRVLLWEPRHVPRVDLEAALAGAEQARPVYHALDGHTAPVRAVAFSPDGRRLVSAGFDNTLRIWDVASRKLVKTLRGHAGRVAACAFASDGERVVSSSHDREAKLWSLSAYAESRVLEGRVFRGHRDAVLGAAFSPDGTRIASASRDRTARLWDAATGSLLAELREGHAFLVSSAAFSADGKRLVTAAADNSAIVWRVDTGAELHRLPYTGTNAALAMSPSGRRVLTGGHARGAPAAQGARGDEAAAEAPTHPAKLWDGETGQLIRDLPGHRAAVTAVALSHDEQHALTADASGRCYLWDAESGAPRWHAAQHSRTVTAAVFLPSGERVLTASLDNTVAQWDAASGKEIADGVLKHPDAVTSMSLSSDGRRLLTACGDGQVRLWDLAGPRVLATLGVENEAVLSVAFSPDDRWAIATHFDTVVDRSGKLTIKSEGKLRLWDLTTQREVRPDGRPWLAFAGDEQLWKAIYHPGGRHVLTLAGDEACLWDLATRTPRVRFYPHGALASVAFSPDGRRLLTGSWDTSARLWDTESGRAKRNLDGGHDLPIDAVAFSPDGTTALTAGEDGVVVLWNAATGEPFRRLVGHRGPVRAAVFSPDGARILTASDDGTARLWDVAAGRTLHELKGHDLAVLSAAFSRDGTRALTGSADNSAKVWDVDPAHAPRELIALRGHTAGVTSVAFSPDGRRALTGSQDRTAKIWDARSKEQILAEMFTAAELDEFAQRNLRLADLVAEEQMQVGKELLTFAEHSEEVTTVSFSPDGNTVLTGSRDGKLMLRLAAEWRPTP